MSRMDRRTAFLRISREANRIGFETVRIDETTTVRYNADLDTTLMDVLLDHAARHDGRVLVPFNTVVSVKSLNLCSQFIMSVQGGGYIHGLIDGAGDGYHLGMEVDGYSAPSLLLEKKAGRWVKVHDLSKGSMLDTDGYVLDSWDDGEARTLTETLKRSHEACMIVYEGGMSATGKGM